MSEAELIERGLAALRALNAQIERGEGLSCEQAQQLMGAARLTAERLADCLMRLSRCTCGAAVPLALPRSRGEA